MVADPRHFRIDPNDSDLPLYIQVRDHIRGLIEAGTIQPGEKLPAERVLRVQYGICRLTIRRGVDELVAAGLIKRRQGIGTFVERKPENIFYVSNPNRIIEQLGQTKATRTTTLQSIDTVDAPKIIAEQLQINVGAPLIQLQYVTYIDDVACMVETVSLSQQRFPTLLDEDLHHQTLHTILRIKYGLTIQTITHTLMPTVLREPEANILSTPTGHAAMSICFVSVDTEQNLVESSVAILLKRCCEGVFVFDSPYPITR